MEREGREGRGRRGGDKMRGKKGIIVGGMILGLLLGCNNGMAELEKRNTFFDSVIKIGHEFQGIFGIFGNAMGGALGFNAVKSTDNRNAVGSHFDKVKQGLENTKNKLNELSGKISETKNADGNAVKVVEEAIKGANGVCDKLIGALNKLVGVTNDSSAIGHNAKSAATGAHEESVKTVIAEVKEIIKTAKESGVNVVDGSPGKPVGTGDRADATAILSGNANANAVGKLAEEVAKADPWAMIDKIKDAKTDAARLGDASSDKDAGILATGTATSDNNGAGAATNADLAAAVALKAMIKSGALSAQSSESNAVKEVAVSAVNKVLGGN